MVDNLIVFQYVIWLIWLTIPYVWVSFNQVDEETFGESRNLTSDIPVQKQLSLEVNGSVQTLTDLLSALSSKEERIFFPWKNLGKVYVKRFRLWILEVEHYRMLFCWHETTAASATCGSSWSNLSSER